MADFPSHARRSAGHWRYDIRYIASRQFPHRRNPDEPLVWPRRHPGATSRIVHDNVILLRFPDGTSANAAAPHNAEKRE